MRGEVFPGLKLSEIREMVPGIHVSEEQGKQIKEEGWFWSDHTETQDELCQRVKDALNVLKDLAKGELQGKAVFAVSHGQFLHNLILNIQSMPTDKQIVASCLHIPLNNSLTILDFDLEDGVNA